MNNDYAAACAAVPHRLELEGREKLLISGVEDVERFDETGIVLSTADGVLTVTGEGLHIGQLSLEGGELRVDGRIDSLSYEEPVRAGGLLHRLFG
jgi:sporulation protein YabP